MSRSARGHLLVGTAGRQLFKLDERKLGTPLEQRESPLKFQTRAVACVPGTSPASDAYAAASIEGRVAIEYGDAAHGTSYAFKCHRQGSTIYPVNALCFNPVYGTFASGGADGCVYVWDAKAKKRLASFTVPTSVAALDFSADGTLLAMASSYTFEEGEKADVPPDEVYVRQCLKYEVAPKNWQDPPGAGGAAAGAGEAS